ncbi:amidohydrolase family protein [Tenacibaculum sp. SG-28]|uniref:amidohydrolase family protein n=1 Tax=Tenacibaculum sp. SG-28 TaxID=754426 RepID=UPI000CF48DF5|nr:amidohydrolase family protein [Tenacibaculum sp. SG-28]PQJ23016.1 amidohydrolase [Tenacibaculum sp. SG-28]
MKHITIYTLFYFFLVGNSIAQQTPGRKQTKDFTIEGATAHIGNGKIIENSLLMFSEGKITFVGSANMKIARKGEVINAKGKHLYPGFIAANTSLGLAEIDAVRATVDDDEVGSMLPHIRSLIAYNAESKIIETMRPNGVLLGQITPRGGTISGTSSIVQFDAWNWEDAAIKTNDGIHVNWPSLFARGRWWLGEDPSLKPNKNYTKNTAKIKDFFRDAKRYLTGEKKSKNLPYEALKNVFEGTQKVYVHVNGASQIQDAITMFRELAISNLVIVGGFQAEKIASILKQHTIPVILERSHRLPSNEDEDYDLPYRTAKILFDAGITVGLGMDGEMERMSARNLPFYAGTYAAYGLAKEVAVSLITLNNAKILGIDTFTGSLEVGKDATLFISDGDALDMRGNIVRKAFIQGRNISLETHQTKLWKRYTKKYK